jgi:hypothetical protein
MIGQQEFATALGHYVEVRTPHQFFDAWDRRPFHQQIVSFGPAPQSREVRIIQEDVRSVGSIRSILQVGLTAVQ